MPLALTVLRPSLGHLDRKGIVVNLSLHQAIKKLHRSCSYDDAGAVKHYFHFCAYRRRRGEAIFASAQTDAETVSIIFTTAHTDAGAVKHYLTYWASTYPNSPLSYARKQPPSQYLLWIQIWSPL